MCAINLATTWRLPAWILHASLTWRSPLTHAPGADTCTPTLCNSGNTCNPLPCPICSLPAGEFDLEIASDTHPEQNTSLEGLYKSGGNFCTQVRCRVVGSPLLCFGLCDKCDALRVPISCSLDCLCSTHHHTRTHFQPALCLQSPMLHAQCEAEGFRGITFFQDRPDVMAK